MTDARRRDVLAIPQVRHILQATCAFRFAACMDWLVLLLAVTAAADVTTASRTLMTYALGIGIGGPLLGRTADRVGPRLVLVVTALTFPFAYLLAVSTAVAGHGALASCATLLAGLLLPPVAACSRAAWSTVLPEAEQRSTAFSLDVVLMELVEVAGPLLVAASLLVSTPLAACTVALAGCSSALALARALPSSRFSTLGAENQDDPGRLEEEHQADPPLQRRHGRAPTRLIPITVATLLVSVTTASMPVAAAVFAARGHSPGYAAAWVALSACGSLVGALSMGTRLRRWRAGERLPWHMLAVGLGVGLIALAVPFGPVAFAIAGFVGSAALGPMFGAVFEALDDVAGDETRTQAHAVLGTAVRVGDAAGSGVTGLIAGSGPVAVLVLGVGASATAAAALACAHGRGRAEDVPLELVPVQSPSTTAVPTAN